MTSVNDIRSTFLEFFQKNGHVIVPSSPLVPHNDPTLMFTNAGMVPFKNVFTGVEKRDYTQATSSQKCVRAGGKHNDLDNVGFTARHHTFFEMLGNFSFGDYFKERAIELAWDLVTKEFDLDPSRLTVTIFADDEEAGKLWKKIAGLPDERIIPIATSDNFWSMGETGPCGPCSEIFFDHGDKIEGGPPGSADEDGDRFVEIWNLVFMQYDAQIGGGRLDLPSPSIDTGMGLERIAAVLQGTHDNYEIDLFRKLIKASVEATGVKAKGEFKATHRIIADHLRASSFLIADGVLPSNEGRGYVLRRIMRRAMRQAHILGAKDPLMYRLVPTLAREMGQAYPELIRAEALITETLKLEETRFRKTLARGLDLLDEATSGMKAGDELKGDVAFKLYDTYGFPLDLTQDALKARKITVDLAKFDEAMERQKRDARKAWSGSGETATDEIWFDLREQFGATEFLGYESERAEGEITALIKGGKAVKQFKKGDDGELITNQTPFYGESGGQVGDIGMIEIGKAQFRVTDTRKKLGDLVVHQGVVEKGPFKLGQVVNMEVDHDARTATRANHSATHILHEALRQVLGDHVAQKGSLVGPEKLRFDFSHHMPMEHDEIARVERIVNEIILQNAPVETRLMATDDAMEAGAMALFGEKYGDEVRVVSMGDTTVPSDARAGWSVELCGGTHVGRTGDIGLMRITGEAAVASGVRRIEALTANGARDYLIKQDELLKASASALKTSPDGFGDRLQSLINERKSLQKQLDEAKRTIALGGGNKNGADGAIRDVGDTKILARTLHGISPKDLRGLVDDGKREIGSGIVTIIGVSEDGKAGIVVGVTEDLVGSYNAVDLVRRGAEAMGGKGGGGRPDMAQAGGPDGENAENAIAAIMDQLSS